MTRTSNGFSVEDCVPQAHKTVMLYRAGDLYPIVGWWGECAELGRYYILEEGGPEDGEHRKYPHIPGYNPTHWRATRNPHLKRRPS